MIYRFPKRLTDLIYRVNETYPLGERVVEKPIEENYAKGGLAKGYHKMPDGTIMKDSEHYAKGGKLRNTEYNLRTFFTFDGEDFAIFGGHLYGAGEGDNEFMLIDNINYAPKEVQVAYYEKMKGFAKGGEVKKSEKYGSEYKKEDGQLLFRPINTKEDWSEVSDEAFNKEERKDFDKEMNRIFKKGGKTDTKISNLVTVGAIEKP